MHVLFFLSGGDFKHCVIIELMCGDIIHYVVVVNERDKLQSKYDGLITCRESEQSGFKVRVGLTMFLSE